MKLVGKKLYRTRPIKLYKGGFGGGGGPGVGGIAESIGDALPQAGTLWEGPQPVPVPDPPEFSNGRPIRPPEYVPYPIEGPQPVPMPVEPEPAPIRPPDVTMPVKPSPSPIGPVDDPGEGYGLPELRPPGEMAGIDPNPRPVQRPWDEEESFTSISEQLGGVNPEGPQPVQDIEWQAGVEGPGIFGQERPQGGLTQLPNIAPGGSHGPQRPTDYSPPEGPAGEGEVQTLRQTVSILRQELADLRQQLAAANSRPSGKPEVPWRSPQTGDPHGRW